MLTRVAIVISSSHLQKPDPFRVYTFRLPRKLSRVSEVLLSLVVSHRLMLLVPLLKNFWMSIRVFLVLHLNARFSDDSHARYDRSCG